MFRYINTHVSNQMQPPVFKASQQYLCINIGLQGLGLQLTLADADLIDIGTGKLKSTKKL